jgi:hypothetical protein
MHKLFRTLAIAMVGREPKVQVAAAARITRSPGSGGR